MIANRLILNYKNPTFKTGTNFADCLLCETIVESAMKPLKIVIIITGSVLLSSCATLQVMSFGISALSYTFTGKSVTDHVISEITTQDCALHRIVLGEQACLDGSEDYIAVLNAPVNNQLIPEPKWQTLNDNAPNNHPHTKQANLSQQQSASSRITVEEISLFTPQTLQHTSLTARTANSSAPQHLASKRAPLEESFYDRIIPTDQVPKLYAVVGTFTQRVYAQTRQHEYQHHQAHLVTNGQRYQVVIGPLSGQQYTEFAALEHKEPPWRTRLCQDLTPAPCNTAMLASR